MKKLVYILVTVLLVLTACTGTSRHPQLVAADSLLLTQPDSALTLLRSMSFSSTADRMYHYLLLADACITGGQTPCDMKLCSVFSFETNQAYCQKFLCRANIHIQIFDL